MQLYNWRWQKLKWKDFKTSNDKTQVQAYANEVRAEKGMESKWSPRFGLDELMFDMNANDKLNFD